MSSAGGKSREPAELAPLVGAVYYLVNGRVAERLVAAGFRHIRAAHGKVFENLGPDSTVSSLAERAQISKQSMAELVSHLEIHGYLRRVPDPRDRRARLVRPTVRGRRAALAARQALADLFAEWERLIGPRRFATTRRALEEILRAEGAPPDAGVEPGATPQPSSGSTRSTNSSRRARPWVGQLTTR